MAFSVSRMESIRSCRCALRNSWRCCASWILLHGRRVHRRPSLRCGRGPRCKHCSASAMASASGIGSSAAASSSTGQFSSLRLVSSRNFSSACLRTSSSSICERFSRHVFHEHAQRLEFLFPGAQAFAHGRILRGHLIDAGFQAAGLFGQQRGHLVELDIVGQQPRALFAHPLDLAARWRCAG